jgi:hypothetical protein
MSLSEKRRKEIEEEEKYRNSVVASINNSNKPTALKHGATLVLSIFIPGLGQLVKGEVKKGLWIFFGPIIVFLIILIFSFAGGNGASVFSSISSLWLLSIILYFWQLFDAYNN